MKNLCTRHNEAKIAYMHKEVKSKVMLREDEIDVFLANIKDLNEKIIIVVHDSNNTLVHTLLDALPNSYQTFAST